VRWDRLFDDFEAQLDAADREDLAAEVADRTRREVAQVQLHDRLRQATGGEVELSLDGQANLRGIVRRAGSGWLLLEVAPRAEAVVTDHAILAIRGLPVAATAVAGFVETRLDLGHLLRIIARDRSAVTVVLRGGAQCAGTIDRVGADFLDLAEHAVGQPRRAADVSGTRTVAFAGIAVVRTG
jgi:hypothetical protein